MFFLIIYLPHQHSINLSLEVGLSSLSQNRGLQVVACRSIYKKRFHTSSLKWPRDISGFWPCRAGLKFENCWTLSGFSAFHKKNLESEETLALSHLLPRRKSFPGACSYTSLKDLALSLCPTANPDLRGSLQDDRWNDPDCTIDSG